MPLMDPVVTDKPYVPVPPYHGTIWPRLLNRYISRYLRRRYGTAKVDVEGDEKLTASIEAGHGVLVVGNHCRDEDPFVLSALARKIGRPFFVLASAHLFMGSRLQAFMLRRAGAYSIYREGMDKQAVQTSIEILASAERPLTIFPEGHVSRTNDRLTPMLEGTALIARQAAKRRAKENKKVVVHPIATRYTFLFDVESAAAGVLDEIERRLTWPPARGMPVLERLGKVGAGLLALKELHYLNRAQDGPLHERIPKLIDAILSPIEDQWANGNHDGHPVARVKRLRAAILPGLIKGDLDDTAKSRCWQLLDDAAIAQQLAHYPPDYVTPDGPKARIMETVERFEEDLTGEIKVHGPTEARVVVGEAIEVSPAREGRGEVDPLMTAIDTQLRAMLGIPPAESEGATA